MPSLQTATGPAAMHPGAMIPPPAPYREYGFGGRTVATLGRDGRIDRPGEAAMPAAFVGYRPPQPTERMLAALAAILEQDLAAEFARTPPEGQR